MPLASSSLELALVVPVYNEESSIVPVLTEWRAALARHVANYIIFVVDDGSTDNTPQRLAELDWPELRVHRHTNRGHGQSCLVGYQLAADAGAQYVFQIDSDGQCDPAEFEKIWRHRGEKPAVYGRRTSRDDGFARRVISSVLRFTLKATQSTRLNDTNVPFRLYETQAAATAAARVPKTFDLANIGVALVLEPAGFIEESIHFRDRMGGHPSVRWWGFARKARKLLRDLKTLKHA